MEVAADFYHGEMETRRHDRTGTPPGERGLLFGYWLRKVQSPPLRKL
ncbi:hypothetical protein [Streptomyces sp. SA15]|nr:hypothetical protein [Streptomyces sp. SA15]